MQRELIEKLSAINDEERRILSGTDLDKKFYSAETDFIINDKRLTRGKFEATMRTHPRYVPFPPHKHTFSEMMIVLSGKIVHNIGGCQLTLGEGDILLLDKHTTHSIEQTGTEDIGVNLIISDKFAVALSPELDGTIFAPFFRENAKATGEGCYLYFRTKGDKDIENLTENLISSFLGDERDEYIAAKTLTLLFYHLSKKRATLLKNTPREFDREGERRLEILSYIKNNYRTASLTELSAKLSLSVPYLSKIIVREFGKGFKDILLDERMKRAAEMLVTTDIAIGTVIRNMGYENQSYFHREFKKRLGTTPLALRRAKK